jgi:hypothetical protein
LEVTLADSHFATNLMTSRRRRRSLDLRRAADRLAPITLFLSLGEAVAAGHGLYLSCEVNSHRFEIAHRHTGIVFFWKEEV